MGPLFPIMCAPLRRELFRRCGVSGGNYHLSSFPPCDPRFSSRPYVIVAILFFATLIASLLQSHWIARGVTWRQVREQVLPARDVSSDYDAEGLGAPLIEMGLEKTKALRSRISGTSEQSGASERGGDI